MLSALRITIAVVCLLAAASRSLAQATDGASELERANALLLKRQYKAAESAFDTVLRIDAANRDALIGTCGL